MEPCRCKKILPKRHDAEIYNPGEIVPFQTHPWPPGQTPPCYLPQKYSRAAIEEYNDPRASAQLTTPRSLGIRPVVDKYSITKYTIDDWRHHNALTLEDKPIRNASDLEVEAKNCLVQTHAIADREYIWSSDLLKDRAQDIYRYKSECEYCIKAMTDEIVALEEFRQRLKRAFSILEIPESIAKECLELRSNRLEPDLVKDAAEEELIKELELIAEIRNLFNKSLSDVDNQMKSNKSCKERVEFDWSDKVVSYDTETLNISLNNKSNLTLMKPGAVRVPDGQSSVHSWEQFCKDNLERAEESRQISMMLRKNLDVMLLNTSRDLRTQAERVDQALAEKATCTDEMRVRLEDELKQTLQKLVNMENVCEELKDAMIKMYTTMKVAQTRLDNRYIVGRPNVENCRDDPQRGLLEEVNAINKCIQSLEKKVQESNDVRFKLLQHRSALERDILIKKKSLNLDRERCPVVRSFYPSASHLSGHE